ncbi:HPP family protein [Malaciobacter marinus]|uniref:HPP family protein n=1 Tax=Malaciobacter marinus TaxID=505249 RepID=UPI0018C8BA61|nr:HPP family protein [Malaciobacter marinus]
MNCIKKIKGNNAKLPPKANATEVAFAFIGALIAISVVAYLTNSYENIFIMGSFGATCVLLFGFSDSPFSQPRNIFFGHVISTFMGLFFFHFVGNYWWSLALALALAIAVMLLTRTVHPPAGSNPVIVFIMVHLGIFYFFQQL